MSIDSDSEISALKNQLFAQLIALIVISGTLTVFLYRQASVAGKDLQAIKPQATQTINNYNQNQNLVVSFVNQVVVYGQTHPEFKPVLAKYGIVPPPPGTPVK
jgi:hypothetical protein